MAQHPIQMNCTNFEVLLKCSIFFKCLQKEITDEEKTCDAYILILKS